MIQLFKFQKYFCIAIDLMLVNISSEIFEQSSGLPNRSKIEKKKTYVKSLLALKCEMQFKKFCIIKLTTQVVRRNRKFIQYRISVQTITASVVSYCQDTIIIIFTSLICKPNYFYKISQQFQVIACKYLYCEVIGSFPYSLLIQYNVCYLKMHKMH